MRSRSGSVSNLGRTGLPDSGNDRQIKFVTSPGLSRTRRCRLRDQVPSGMRRRQALKSS